MSVEHAEETEGEEKAPGGVHSSMEGVLYVNQWLGFFHDFDLLKVTMGQHLLAPHL